MPDTPSNLSPSLERELQTAFGRSDALPHRVDAAVMAAAAGRLASVRRRRWMLRAAPIAAAAVVLLSWGIWANRGQLGATSQSEPTSPLASAPATSVSNVTDIVDVLRLARDVRDQRTVDVKFDLNADGSITQTDLDLLALRLVSLSESQRKGGAS